MAKTLEIKCKTELYLSWKDLVPYQGNLKELSRANFEKLKKEITQTGFAFPIYVTRSPDNDWKILGGHQRIRVIQKLYDDGYTIPKLPCVEIPWESEKMMKRRVLQDVSQYGQTDPQGLYEYSIENDFEISDIVESFDIPNIDLDSWRDEFAIEENEVEGEDEIPEQVEPKTKLGDLYKLGNHRLLCGDSTDIKQVEKLMNGDKADMVFTDPPYGVSYEKKTQEIANQSKSRHKSTISGDDLSVEDLKAIIFSVFKNIDSVLADKSNYYVCSPQGGELGLMMMMMQDANLICRHMIIWVKNAPVFSMGRLDYDYRHEPILYGWSKNRTHHKLQKGKFQNSVWEISREPNKEHPTMKPVELPVNAIENSCPIGGNVIDLFGGSGSTLIACEKTSRKCFMMELDPHYCDVIVSRWEKYTSKKAELITTDDTNKPDDAKSAATKKNPN